MNEYVAKLMEIEKKASEEKGPFTLFALFHREDTIEKWDLLVASPWIEENKKEALHYLASELRERLTPNELVKISHIALIDEDNPGLIDLAGMETTHSHIEVTNRDFFGIPIKRAHIITSRVGKPLESYQ